jgi:drug/metabolite transporter, DME family
MPSTVYVLALVGALCAASATIFIRHGLRDANPYTGVWINLLVGTVGLWSAVLLMGPLESVDAKGVAYFAAAGLVGTLSGRLLRFVSIEKVGASVSTAVINLSPFISSGLAILLLGEHMTLPILAGTVVIVLGTILLSTTGRQMGFRPIQLAFPFLSASCFGVVAILRKLGLSQTGPVFGFAVNVATGLLIFTVFLTVSGNRQAMVCKGRSLAHFIAAGVAENTGVFLGVVALKLGTVSVVAPLSGVSPIFVLLLSFLFLRGIERLTARVVVGTVLIVLGVYLITAG